MEFTASKRCFLSYVTLRSKLIFHTKKRRKRKQNRRRNERTGGGGGETRDTFRNLNKLYDLLNVQLVQSIRAREAWHFNLLLFRRNSRRWRYQIPLSTFYASHPSSCASYNESLKPLSRNNCTRKFPRRFQLFTSIERRSHSRSPSSRLCLSIMMDFIRHHPCFAW
jgi:hypothetical protein